MRFPEGSGKQGMVERNCCNVICGALTTSEVKGLRDETFPSSILVLNVAFIHFFQLVMKFD